MLLCDDFFFRYAATREKVKCVNREDRFRFKKAIVNREYDDYQNIQILRIDGCRFREHIAPRYFRRSLHLVTLFAVRREQRTGGV